MTSISSNVRINSRFEMGSGSSNAQNCTISVESASVFIGENVMIEAIRLLTKIFQGFLLWVVWQQELSNLEFKLSSS